MIRSLIIVLLATLLFASKGAAQPSDGEGVPPLWGDAVRAFEEGRYEEAADAFERLAQLDPRPAVYCNLGTTYERWGGHIRQAINAFERCAATDTENRFREHALERAQALRSELPPETETPEPVDPPNSDAVDNPFSDPANNEGTGPNNGGVVEVHHHPQPQPQPGRAPERGHGLLGVGIVVAAIGGGLAAGGAVMAGQSRDDEDWLDERYPGEDRVVIPQGSEEARRYNRAERKRNTAIGLYVGAAAFIGTGLVMAIIDLAGGLAAPVYVAPQRAGATVGVQSQF